MPRAIRITSASGALTVNVTGPAGNTPVVYADSTFSATTSLPATIADGATSTLWLKSPGAYTLSVKTSSGTEIAGDNNQPRTVDLETDGTVAALSYDTRFTHRIEGDSGRGSDTGDTSSAFAAIGATGILIDVTKAPYNVVADGVTDYTTTLTQAATDAAAQGGGTILLPNGTVRAAGLPIKTGVHWRGRGRGTSVVKAPNGTTTHVFIGDNFATLTGTSAKAGPFQWSLRHLSVHGNKASCPSGGHGVAVYGYEFTIEDVDIYQCKSEGFHLEFDDVGSVSADYTTTLMESFVTRLKVFDCDGHGVNATGGHDTMWTNCISARNGSTSANFHVGGVSHVFADCHAWGATAYAWHLLGRSFLSNCQGEGATSAQFWVEFDDVTIVGGRSFYPGDASSTGLLFGNATHNAARVMIRGLTFDKAASANEHNPAIDVTYLGAAASVDVMVNQASGSVLNGSFPGDAHVNMRVTGGATQTNVVQMPGFSASGATPISTPPAVYDHFTAADNAVLDSTKWTVTTGGAAAASVKVVTNRARFAAGQTGGYSATDFAFALSTLSSTLQDQELLFKVVFRSTTAENYFWAGVRASQAKITTGSGYAIRSEFSAGGLYAYSIRKYVAGVETVLLSPSFGAAPATGSARWFRLGANGTLIYFKTWLDGTSEPGAYTWSGTDAGVSSGVPTMMIGGGSAAAVASNHDVDQVQIYALA